MAHDTPAELAAEITRALRYRIGKEASTATPYDWLNAATQVVRDRIADTWVAASDQRRDSGDKDVYYLSLEFLIGRLTTDAFSNLGLLEPMRAALSSLGIDLDELVDLEPDAALGNGGLGRLAACFMESMATIGVPANGYGIRYINGMFRQEIVDGRQVELPETWLSHGNPWEFERRERSYEIGYGGTSQPVDADPVRGASSELPHVWTPSERVLAVAYDTPIVGWRGRHVNTLRLWSSMAVDSIQLDRFNEGDHVGALAESNRAESLSRVLYPADSHRAGQELRLRQEYFFSAASLYDIIQRHLRQYPDLTNLGEKVAIHLNDTHPAVAVAELVRQLVDLYGMAFVDAWNITRATFAYTNHTLLPEALESWPVSLFEQLLPRHMQIVYAINARLLAEARATGRFDGGQISQISLIQENGDRRVRMGNLAFAGSHSINGVSALHTDLMRRTVFADLHHLYPERINNKTNGVTPRRWLFQANPDLTALIVDAIGPAFLDDFDRLADLDALATDSEFQKRFAAVKDANKVRLAALAAERTGIVVDPTALFDVQIKRIHEYKRQLLNILHAITMYQRIIADPSAEMTPRVKFFGGKAAPSYVNAKLIINLANDVAATINNDPRVAGRLAVVFVPNYNVSAAEVMIPGANLSEQISTAGLEASGTGNMKFALNGAVTIGTLDGANVEISERVGDDNIVIFGMTADEVLAQREAGYVPADFIVAEPDLAWALDAVAQGTFSQGDAGHYRPLIDGLYQTDNFMLAADFGAYAAAQRRVDELWADQSKWNEIAIHNVARCAWFSSDRTIAEYASEIWQTHEA